MITSGIILMLVGGLGYVLNAYLMYHFLEKRAPGLLDTDTQKGPALNGKYRWEYTAGKGLVPKWVSLVGLLGVLAFITGAFLLITGAVVSWMRTANT